MKPTLEDVKEYFKNAKEINESGYNKLFIIDWDEVYLSQFNNWCMGIGLSTYYLWNEKKGFAEIKSYKEEIETPKTDSIVESVINQFSERSKRGIEKYGTTLQENNTDDFLQHFKEELMDAILYIEKLQSLRNGTK